jgi:hypothetical protein
MPYRFKKDYQDAIISIPGMRLTIDRFTLTGEIAEKILKKFPKYAHNIEQYEGEEGDDLDINEQLSDTGDSEELDGEDAQDIPQENFVTDEPRESQSGDKEDFITGEKIAKKTPPKSNKTTGKGSSKKK